MAKNRVANDRNPKKKDSFFKKTQSKFTNHKSQFIDTNKESRQSSNTNSDSFFVKPSSAAILKKPETSKVHSTHNPEADKKPEKKPFDKKKYRLQKYSKKYKLQQWEDRRKKSVLRGYYRNLKEDEINPAKKIYEEESEINETDSDSEISINKYNKPVETEENEKQETTKEDFPKNSKERKNKSFRKAQQEFQRIKEEKHNKKELQLKRKAEKEEALEAYKKKKTEKFKKLNQKNKKGQPIMKGRLEMLLEQIQNSVKQE